MLKASKVVSISANLNLNFKSYIKVYVIQGLLAFPELLHNTLIDFGSGFVCKESAIRRIGRTVDLCKVGSNSVVRPI